MYGEPLDVYTDGSCNPNPGQGGWAYVIPSTGIEKSGAENNTTNNRMEMRAIIEALRETSGYVRIFSDSQMSIYILQGIWKAKKNRDLFHEAKILMTGRYCAFQWVRGHNGNSYNERADYLAGRARAESGKLFNRRKS